MTIRAFRLMRPDGLAVDRENARAVSTKAKREDACVCSIHQSQPDPLAGANRELVLHGSVHRHRVADAARVRHVVGVPESLADLSARRDAPIIQHPGHVTVHRRRLPLLHDQGSVQSAIELFGALEVRVIPLRAGIEGVELVDEALPRLDGGLRQVWNTIHGVRQPHAVPMNGRRHGESVRDVDANAVALANP